MSTASVDATIRLARRCRVRPDEAGDLAARCAAVLRTSAPDTVIVSWTAARLHGLWLPDAPDRIEIATAVPDRGGEQMTRTRRPELLARRLELEPDETMTIAGLPVTTPERTWRDLAPRLGLPALVAAGDSVLRSGIAVDALVASVARGKRARGVRRAREAVELLDGRSASRPESHLRVAASLGGALRFAVNEAISRRDGGWLATPDLSLGEARLALEYQGDAHAELDRMRRDLTRFADLRREGWLVLAYGPAEVFGRPWEIEADVRRALHERAPHYLRARLAR